MKPRRFEACALRCAPLLRVGRGRGAFGPVCCMGARLAALALMDSLPKSWEENKSRGAGGRRKGETARLCGWVKEGVRGVLVLGSLFLMRGRGVGLKRPVP